MFDNELEFEVLQSDINESIFYGIDTPEDLAQKIMEINEQCLLERDIVPSCGIIFTNDSFYSIFLKVDNPEIKSISYDLVFSFASQLEARAICIVSEALVADKISDDINDELIIVHVSWHDLRKKTLGTFIKRNDDGDVIRLIRDDTTFDGVCDNEDI